MITKIVEDYQHFSDVNRVELSTGVKLNDDLNEFRSDFVEARPSRAGRGGL
jgi:hypothetical protein